MAYPFIDIVADRKSGCGVVVSGKEVGVWDAVVGESGDGNVVSILASGVGVSCDEDLAIVLECGPVALVVPFEDGHECSSGFAEGGVECS